MSFIKTKKDQTHIIPGTKTSILTSQLLLTSSGTPSLDHLFGGGLPCGSLLILEEDTFSEYSRILLKYFLSEGIVCNHSVFLASLDSDVNELISELPLHTNPDTDGASDKDDSKQSLRIAWRYENLERVDPSLKPNIQFGHYFDLSKHIDKETISNSTIELWQNNSDNKDYQRGGDFENPAFQHLLRAISNKIKENAFNPASQSDQSNILRIGIESIGSPFWSIHEVVNPSSVEGKDLVKFIYCLRMLLRSTLAVAFLTIPSYLFQNPECSVIKRIRHSADYVLKLESFAGSDKETNPIFKDYHGLVYVHKIAAINVLIPYAPAALDLAFKLRRKKFIIEKLHLPPELQESTEREQDDIVSSVSCSATAKNNLDF